MNILNDLIKRANEVLIENGYEPDMKSVLKMLVDDKLENFLAYATETNQTLEQIVQDMREIVVLYDFVMNE